MGRAERRAMERMQKQEQRQADKYKIWLTHEELNQIKEAAQEDTAAASCEMWFVAFGIYLRDCEHYGYKRMKRAFNYIDNLMTRINNEEVDFCDLKQRLIDEAQIEIRVR